ncbi:putative Ketopantoate reductase [metagenome]|uniref:Putative Ketopantoate reductase n=1 Tax=metagenome TaxID=256318 RepID=A0A2P2C0I3_9ZZZZ
MTSPRIAILGAGANGGSIGVDLHRAGLDVTLIEQWPEHVRAIRDKGLTVNTPEGSTTTTGMRALDICQVATLREKFDVVLMLMKAYDSTWAAHLIEPYLATDGLLVGVQNGMTHEAVRAVVGAERSLGCVIEISSTMYEPGVIDRHSGQNRSWFAVGSEGPESVDREKDASALLAHSGAVEIVDDIVSAKWMKLVSNATTLVTTASLGLTMMGAESTPGMREVMVGSGNEALRAAIANGAQITPIFGLTAEAVKDPATVVETLLDTLYGGFILPNTTTTILQDWNKHRHSEVNDINGHVVRASAAKGLAAPINAAVVELAHAIETGQVEPGLEHLGTLRTAGGFGPLSG